MANNPFNAASATTNALASASPMTDQFANFGQQNNPFNPQPPKPTSISNVSGNQFALDMQKGSQPMNPTPRAPTAVPTVQPLTLDANQNTGNMTPPAAPMNPVVSAVSMAPISPNAYSTTTPPPSQQQGLIRGAIGRQ